MHNLYLLIVRVLSIILNDAQCFLSLLLSKCPGGRRKVWQVSGKWVEVAASCRFSQGC